MKLLQAMKSILIKIKLNREIEEEFRKGLLATLRSCRQPLSIQRARERIPANEKH
jgi:hypothetical protein